jgi:hypothetical protein
MKWKWRRLRFVQVMLFAGSGSVIGCREYQRTYVKRSLSNFLTSTNTMPILVWHTENFACLFIQVLLTF